jgi:glycyl-tRNA synthetase beta chain
VAERTEGELLLEVRAEEIPARMLEGASRELATRVFEELVARGLTPGEVEVGYTPRRLWLVLRKLPRREQDRFTRVLGPAASVAWEADGAPSRAAEGFARKLGIAVGQLRRREFSPGVADLDVPEAELGQAVSLQGQEVSKPVAVKAKGEYAYVPVRFAGRSTAEVLADLLPAVLRGIAWAKSMRWGAGVGPWVRPVHGVVAIFDGAVVPFELFGVASGKTTAGHPTLSAAPFEVADAADWRARLAALGIVVSPEERRGRLLAGMQERAAAHGGRLVDDPPLLDKLAAICEIPGVMEGTFDAALLELPREVLTSSLADHQSALTVERGGALAPVFLTVMDRADDPAGRVRAGNEWVVAARLADARFFWEKDRARPLGERVGALAALTFHARLGSYADKSTRVTALAGALAEATGAGVAAGEVARAASLAKADLTTEMVREFTSLQGVMGGIYARADGEPEAVWQAIYDQYLPAGADDDLPRGTVGRLVALADRLDTLVGFFGLGAKFQPTGSKDPFGLRRAATGVVRLVLAEEAPCDLPRLLETARSLYGGLLPAGPEALAALGAFLWDRAEYLLGRDGLAYDEIAAARDAEGRRERIDLRTARAAARAIRERRDEAAFLAVVHAVKRIQNILRDVREPLPDAPDPARLVAASERELDAARAELARTLATARGSEADFARALEAIGALAGPLDRFFVEVLVMDPDAAVRRNRLALLAALRRAIAPVADLAAVVVDKAELRARAGD